MNQKGRLAWELYLKMGTSSDSFSILQLIANDCYKVTSFCVDGLRLSHLRCSPCPVEPEISDEVTYILVG